MSFPLFKTLIKQNWKLWAIFMGLLLFYMGILIVIYDVMIDFQETLESMPAELGGIYGLEGWENALTYTASFFFQQLVFVFSMIFYIMLSNKLVNKPVDNTSISAHLSSSMSRSKYIVTTGVFLISSIFAMFLVMFFVGGGLLFMWGTYSVLHWANLIFTTAMCSIMVAMVSFFFSAVFAGGRLGSGLLIGVPILFVTFNMLAGMADALSFLDWCNPFGYIDAVALASGSYNLWWLLNLGFIAISASLFVASIFLFRKKQLNI